MCKTQRPTEKVLVSLELELHAVTSCPLRCWEPLQRNYSQLSHLPRSCLLKPPLSSAGASIRTKSLTHGQPSGDISDVNHNSAAVPFMSPTHLPQERIRSIWP